MRKINNIVIHCPATSQATSLESIVRYWQKNLRWKMPGYHVVVFPDGSWTQLLHGSYVSNGVRGHNHDSFHISYIGGVDSKGNPLDNRTTRQKQCLIDRIKEVKKHYPKASILGHRDFKGVSKACPSFDAKTEYKHL